MIKIVKYQTTAIVFILAMGCLMFMSQVRSVNEIDKLNAKIIEQNSLLNSKESKIKSLQNDVELLISKTESK